MFGKHTTLTRLSSGIVIAASVAVVAASSAFATPDWYGYYTHGAGTSSAAPDAVVRYLNAHAGGSPKAAQDAVDRYLGNYATAQGKAFAWDRLGANGLPERPTVSSPVHVNAGMSTEVAQSIRPGDPTQFNNRQPTQAPPITAALSSAGGNGFSWGDAGIGAGLAAGLLLLLLLGAARLRTSRRGVLTT